MRVCHLLLGCHVNFLSYMILSPSCCEIALQSIAVDYISHILDDRSSTPIFLVNQRLALLSRRDLLALPEYGDAFLRLLKVGILVVINERAFYIVEV